MLGKKMFAETGVKTQNELAELLGVSPQKVNSNVNAPMFGNMETFLKWCIATKKDLTPVISAYLAEHHGIPSVVEALRTENETLKIAIQALKDK